MGGEKLATRFVGLKSAPCLLPNLGMKSRLFSLKGVFFGERWNISIEKFDVSMLPLRCIIFFGHMTCLVRVFCVALVQY